MEVKLKELLSTINDRFSGPQSCNMYDMMNGKLDFDDEEVTNNLISLRDYGGMHGNYNKENDRRDAQIFLNRFNEYMESRNKRKR
jgi:hypothetical protein